METWTISTFASWVFMMHHEYSWCSMSTHDAAWVLMMHHEYSWCIMSTHDASWIFMMHHEYSWCIMSTHDASWVLMTHHEYSWRFMCTHDASWVFMMHHENISEGSMMLKYYACLQSKNSFLEFLPGFPGPSRSRPSAPPRDLPSTRAGGQDDVSSKQTLSNYAFLEALIPQPCHPIPMNLLIGVL